MQKETVTFNKLPEAAVYLTEHFLRLPISRNSAHRNMVSNILLFILRHIYRSAAQERPLLLCHPYGALR